MRLRALAQNLQLRSAGTWQRQFVRNPNLHTRQWDTKLARMCADQRYIRARRPNNQNRTVALERQIDPAPAHRNMPQLSMVPLRRQVRINRNAVMQSIDGNP